MAGYWHIAIPYSIRFKDKSSNLALFENKYSRDFSFDRLGEYEKESPPMPDGTVVKWKVVDRLFSVKEELIQAELKAMFFAMAEEWRSEYRAKSIGKFHSSWFEEVYDNFKAQTNSLEINDLSEQTIAKVESLSANYFIHFDAIAKFNVYEGFPVDSDEFSFNIVSLLHSSERMNTSVDETVALHDFAEYFKSKFADTFKLAKYIFICGY